MSTKPVSELSIIKAENGYTVKYYCDYNWENIVVLSYGDLLDFIGKKLVLEHAQYKAEQQNKDL